MASTYEPIATTTLGSAASSITFSSIPATYTDLRLVTTMLGSTTSIGVNLRFNSDSGANYSSTFLVGGGSSAASGRNTGATEITMHYSFLSTTIPTMGEVDIFSYAGSTFKTLLHTLTQDFNGSGNVEKQVGLWRSTSAITTVSLSTTANNFAIGTTATLYGIKAA